jgi:hypothetical protein
VECAREPDRWYARRLHRRCRSCRGHRGRRGRAARPEPHHRVGKRIPCRGAPWDAVPPTRPAHFCNLTFRATRSDDTVCYRPGTDGPLGRRSGFWYERCLSSCQRLGAVRVACGLSGPASADGSVARAISRSRRCFHRAGSVSSWVPPVGRGSSGLTPLAARHTAISLMRATRPHRHMQR